MFNRVLIANRGEIAIRVIRACQELGIETVAVYSDVDAHSLHVQLADYAYNIGPADAALSYYNAEAIISAAKMAKADAIHPGYGFLSENADFAQMVIDAGMIFVGPHPETIRKVGNKDAARLAMKQAGLPMTVGSEIVRETEDAYVQAEAIGYPVILKPVAGGGGKSMFVAHNKEEMTSALNKVDLKSRDFYLENYIDQARHIEVQIMADNYGNILHLGERECSLQRRNQKILEEAPSSALTPEMRHKVGQLAIRAAKSIYYTNVGTVEFLMDIKTGRFYFMEINPRIQVEHAVTEMITGVDLVRRQLRIAAGEPLNKKQDEIMFLGHAIECRINAEDPDTFFPSPGLIQHFHAPGGPGVRVDSHIYEGYRVPPNYDSMIGKLIVHGATREQAIARMRVALSEMVVDGIKTNIPLQQRILADGGFCQGGQNIHYLEKKLAERKEKALSIL